MSHSTSPSAFGPNTPVWVYVLLVVMCAYAIIATPVGFAGSFYARSWNRAPTLMALIHAVILFLIT